MATDHEELDALRRLIKKYNPHVSVAVESEETGERFPFTYYVPAALWQQLVNFANGGSAVFGPRENAEVLSQLAAYREKQLDKTDRS